MSEHDSESGNETDPARDTPLDRDSPTQLSRYVFRTAAAVTTATVLVAVAAFLGRDIKFLVVSAVGLSVSAYVLWFAWAFAQFPAFRRTVRQVVGGILNVAIPGVEHPWHDTGAWFTPRTFEELLDRKFKDLQAARVELDPSERATLVAGIADTVAKSLTDQSVEELRKSIGATRLTEEAAATKARLADAIQKTANRTRNNLLFGIVFSLAAVGILFFSLWPGAITTTPEILRYFLPRISIVLLVELVAYFFLRLYKSGIEEIRYYQNELTNVEARSAALEAALLSNDEALVKSVVSRLASTERNFVLPKGSSTVEVEKARLDQQHSAELLQALGAAIKRK